MVHQSSPSTAFPGRAWSYLAPRELIPTPWNRACQSGQEKEAADPPQVGTTTSEWLDFCKGGWQGPGEAQRLARTAQRPGSVAFIRRMTEEKLVILTHPRLSLSPSLFIVLFSSNRGSNGACLFLNPSAAGNAGVSGNLPQPRETYLEGKGHGR